MLQLTPDECRVLGVLIEKELTTPEQYPLSLNAAVNGCNQKNNRDPVVSFENDRVEDALVGLRDKGLVVQTYLANSRVPKYRNELAAKLELNRYELVILAELLLRGPQTLGELRGRASRMHNLETLEVVQEMLNRLMARPEPLAQAAAIAGQPGRAIHAAPMPRCASDRYAGRGRDGHYAVNPLDEPAHRGAGETDGDAAGCSTQDGWCSGRGGSAGGVGGR